MRVSPIEGEVDPMQVLERSNLQMGSNYLIRDGVVYKVTAWVQGGIADRQIFRPGDHDYELWYRAAATDTHTLFMRGE